MKVYTSLDDFTHIDDVILTLGMFDGVHLAHREILEVITHKAREREGISVVFTFSPHPREVISGQCFPLITTNKEKQKLLEETYVDIWCRIPFTSGFAALSPEEFIALLCTKMSIRHIVLGYNHNFGHQKKGNIHTLYTLKDTYHFEITEIPQLNVQGIPVSSSAVRNALQNGNLHQAENFMGHSYFAFAENVKKQDMQTLCVSVSPEKMLPKLGNYYGQWEQQDVQIQVIENQQMLLYFKQETPNTQSLMQHPIYWKSL